METKKITPRVKNSKDLTPVDEMNPFVALRNNIDRVFDSFFQGFGALPFTTSAPEFYPSIDVTDGDKDIKVTLELPGMDENEIDISISGLSLTVKGEKKEEKEEKGKNYHRMERIYGSFSRTVPLPVEVKAEAANATYKKGVLTVVLPKTEKTQKEVKKIPIKAK